ncbi:hypothetical protein [Undibacterium sp. TJN19]|uniref:hypothetical protein n=1 Tax=Undibacterium sp. TJN19 TaxID=3413055 RepID=UPI003BF1CD6A
MIPENLQFEFAQTVVRVRENLPAIFEYEVLQAKIKRKRFLSLVSEGFTEQQALEMCKS